jgi:hypothetical protein
MRKRGNTIKIYPATFVIEVNSILNHKSETFTYEVKNNYVWKSILKSAIDRYALYNKDYKAYLITEHSRVNDEIKNVKI